MIMQDSEKPSPATSKRTPWNKGKLTGAKPPLRPKHVWSIRTKLQMADRKRDLALFNLAIDSKLRGCDVVTLKVEDIAPHGYAIERATVRQKKTGRPVRFEVTEQTRQAVDDYLRVVNRKQGQFLFAAQRRPEQGLSTRQYAHLLGEWIRGIGLDPRMFGTHSLRRTKATLIYRRTGNLRPSNCCSVTPRSRARSAISVSRSMTLWPSPSKPTFDPSRAEWVRSARQISAPS
jgi:integrase